jgi:hypothetical protein
MIIRTIHESATTETQANDANPNPMIIFITRDAVQPVCHCIAGKM